MNLDTYLPPALRPIPDAPPTAHRSVQLGFTFLWYSRFLARNAELLPELEQSLQHALLENSRPYGLAPTVDIPRIHYSELTPKRFSKIYRNFPVIVEGLLSKNRAVETWSVESLARRFPNTVLPCANQFNDSAPYDDMELAEFVRRLRSEPDKPRYLMASSTLFEKHPELLDELDLPRLSNAFGKDIIRTEMFMGTKRNGSPYHCASSGNLFCNIAGQKDWLLVAPRHSMWMYPQIGRNGLAVYVNSPVLSEQVDEIEQQYPLYQYAPKYRASLTPGDVLYVPPWWWHEVTNRGESIGVPVRLLDSGGGNTAFSMFQVFMALVSPGSAKRVLPVAKHVLLRALRRDTDPSSLYLSDTLTRASVTSSRLHGRGWQRYPTVAGANNVRGTAP